MSFVDPDGVPLPKWLAGQSITVQLPVDGNAGAVVRNYSLSNPPDSGVYRIGLKRESSGRGSGHLHDRVSVGDLLGIAVLRGTFFLVDDDRPVLLLSAGIGITPVLSMLHSFAGSGSSREVWWVHGAHGAHDGTEHPFAGECRELLN